MRYVNSQKNYEDLKACVNIMRVDTINKNIFPDCFRPDKLVLFQRMAMGEVQKLSIIDRFILLHQPKVQSLHSLLFRQAFRCPNTAKVRHLAGILQQFISVLRRPIISMIMSPLKSIFMDLRICLKQKENMSNLPTLSASAMNGA